MTLDTSIVFTICNLNDPQYRRVQKVLSQFALPYRIPVGVLAEIAYLLEQRLGHDTLNAFLNDIQSGKFVLDHAPSDIIRAQQLCNKYQNLPLGLADALVIACAERNGGIVMSLDKHFWVVAGEGTIRVLP